MEIKIRLSELPASCLKSELYALESEHRMVWQRLDSVERILREKYGTDFYYNPDYLASKDSCPIYKEFKRVHSLRIEAERNIKKTKRELKENLLAGIRANPPEEVNHEMHNLPTNS